MLCDPLARSFDTFVVSTITWRLMVFARQDAHATTQLYDAYFGTYAPAWSLDTARYPYINSRRYALEHALIKKAGAAGLLWASKGDSRTRASKRSAISELRLIIRLFVAAHLRSFK